jgi:hypothetical protein
MKLEFLDRFSKNTQISDLIEIRPVAAELFHADRRREMKLLVTFRNLQRDLKMECKLVNSLLVGRCKHGFGHLVAQLVGNCLTHRFSRIAGPCCKEFAVSFCTSRRCTCSSVARRLICRRTAYTGRE